MKLISRLILLSFVFTPFFIKAQDTTINYFSNEFQQRYQFFSKEALSLSLLPLKNYATIEGGFKHTGGDYKLAQDASKQNDLFFRTEGTRQLNKFLVSGSFSYERTTQDSVGYLLRYGVTDNSPLYFFSAKKGNWLAGKYSMNGIVSTPLSKDEKLNAAVGITYQALNSWRNTDPRPDYFTYYMQPDAALNYKLTPHQSIGIQGSYIRKNMETITEIRNPAYKNSAFYPEYMVYLQHGYGYREFRGSGSTNATSMTSKTQGWSLKGIYDINTAVGNFAIKGGYTKQTTSFIKKASTTDANDTDSTYTKYYEKTWNASLYWKKVSAHHYWALLTNYTNHQGKDFSSLLHGNNYVYSLETIKVQPSYGHYKNNQLQYELSLNGSITNTLKADGTADQRAQYNFANVGAAAAYYWHPKTVNTLKVQLQGGAQMPVEASVRKPIQVDDFTTNVIYSDYYFYNENSINGSLEVQYSFPIQKVSTFIKAAGQYTNAYTRTDGPPATSRPGTNRWWWQLSIGVNL